uniref:Uncharacterized protein n=1 Tax=Strongyloides stercoralis TaxID=6248 RepID=A0A0K0DX86_STRER
MKYGKKVMDMDKEELHLVYSAINKLKYPKLDVDDYQEMIIKWLLENKLSIKHIFYFYKDEEESYPHKYLLSRNSEVPCHCCSIISTSYQEFRNEKNKEIININSTKKEFFGEKKDNLIKESINTDVNNVLKQQEEKKSDIILSPNELIKTNNINIKSGNRTKIAAVTEQPKIGEHLKPINIEKEKVKKNNNSCCMWCQNFCTTCKAEFGKCCIDIMGSI